ncbi:MAG TPA: formaldehyde-activating enzyme [Candidatus Dormibacteraeota bacterium]|nr:formaldehyde-activating enzyme [Candidatus Dormibacteraeota bacterium]
MTPDELDGRIGEAWSGTRPDGSHINLVIARRGSPTAAAIVGALASPRPGHVPFLALIESGVLVRPITAVVNKVTIGPHPHDRITWGAAQLGISQGVLDAVADGLIDPAVAGSIVLLVAVWVDPAAADETAVRKANRAATHAAIVDAMTDHSADFVRGVAARREHASNAYYGGS